MDPKLLAVGQAGSERYERSGRPLKLYAAQIHNFRRTITADQPVEVITPLL